MTNSAPLIRTWVSGAGYNSFFFFLFQGTDLPCFFNGPIVRLGQWDKQLSCCICDIKQDVLHGSCMPRLLFCLIITISAIIYIIRSLHFNYSSIGVIHNKMITVALQGHWSSGFCLRNSIRTAAFCVREPFSPYIKLIWISYWTENGNSADNQPHRKNVQHLRDAASQI